MTHHTANVQIRSVRALIVGHALDTSLFDMQLSSETLQLGVDGIAILEALARDSSGVVLVEKIGHAGVLLDVGTVATDHGGKGRSILNRNRQGRVVGRKRQQLMIKYRNQKPMRMLPTTMAVLGWEVEVTGSRTGRAL